MTTRLALLGGSAVALAAWVLLFSSPRTADLLFAGGLQAQTGGRRQPMSEIDVRPNVQGAATAGIPRDYGHLKGIENVGRGTMLWFEADDGTIRRVQVSFWEDEVILDNLVVTLRRE